MRAKRLRKERSTEAWIDSFPQKLISADAIKDRAAARAVGPFVNDEGEPVSWVKNHDREHCEGDVLKVRKYFGKRGTTSSGANGTAPMAAIHRDFQMLVAQILTERAERGEAWMPPDAPFDLLTGARHFVVEHKVSLGQDRFRFDVAGLAPASGRDKVCVVVEVEYRHRFRQNKLTFSKTWNCVIVSVDVSGLTRVDKALVEAILDGQEGRLHIDVPPLLAGFLTGNSDHAVTGSRVILQDISDVLTDWRERLGAWQAEIRICPLGHDESKLTIHYQGGIKSGSATPELYRFLAWMPRLVRYRFGDHCRLLCEPACPVRQNFPNLVSFRMNRATA